MPMLLVGYRKNLILKERLARFSDYAQLTSIRAVPTRVSIVMLFIIVSNPNQHPQTAKVMITRVNQGNDVAKESLKRSRQVGSW